MEHTLDAQTCVETDQVGEGKWTHGVTHTKTECGVDILGCCDTLLALVSASRTQERSTPSLGQ
jgi:hypothetical protein